jgi:pimeloyl-ACP methyl ester carboxylesterase
MSDAGKTTKAPDGRILCFAEWGDPNGRPVFSLHGTPGCRLLSSRKVEYQFDELAGSLGARVITYDRPGYGQSDRNAGRRVVDSAADVATIASAIGLTKFAVEGGSSGSIHAMAAAEVLFDRVTRVGITAPMAPYFELGHELWSQGQSDDIKEYIGWCKLGENRFAAEMTREDAQLRQAAAADDPKQASVVEQTKNGVWGWVDDEMAALTPWGFSASSVHAPVLILYDPEETILPRQHGEWLASHIKGSVLEISTALGHRQLGDPRPDWTRLYKWLIETEA